MSLATQSSTNPKDLDDLINAAGDVSVDHPGYYSTAYYMSQLLNEKGEIEKSSKITNSILTNKEKLSRTTVNLFKTLKLRQVNSLNEFVSLIPRTIAGDDFSSDFEIPDWFFAKSKGKEKRPFKTSIEPTTASVINTGLPVAKLVEIASSKTLGQNIQQRLIPPLWLRAVLLNKDNQAVKLSHKVEKLIPALKKEMVAYRSSKNQKQRKFMALYIALRNPGLRPYVTSGYARTEKINRIDSFRDNWWGKGKIDYYYGSEDDVNDSQIAKITGRILNSKDREAAKEEFKTLLSLGTAPNYLANEIISYAKIYPNDSLIPEALHRAVKATRYGSTDDNTTSFSKACFKLLHKRYKNSRWTKKTPYYY